MATISQSYPLGLPVVSGNQVTLDTMLSEPTRITRFLSDLTLRGMFSQLIFTNGGSVSGGALLFDQLTSNRLFTTRDVQNVEPGAEFPLVTAERPEPRVAQVEKFGGKFFITDEARDRNDAAAIRIPAQQLSNTIQRKIDTRALAVLDASLTETGAATTTVGTNWNAVVTAGTSASSAAAYPAADFAEVQLIADTAELGVVFDLWIVNPAQKSQFQLVYGSEWRSVLTNWGVRDMVATNRVTAGTAYVVESGMVGEMRLEKPLSTETWREELTERTWVQSSVRPVFAVTNPFSITKVTGLAG